MGKRGKPSNIVGSPSTEVDRAELGFSPVLCMNNRGQIEMVRRVVPIRKKERRRLTVEIATPSSKRILRLLPGYSIFIPGLTSKGLTRSGSLTLRGGEKVFGV
ncbi:MAG: hypothetical protein QW356_05755 [Candidatus Hadarchaeales archaeon]